MGLNLVGSFFQSVREHQTVVHLHESHESFNSHDPTLLISSVLLFVERALVVETACDIQLEKLLAVCLTQIPDFV